jgi:hypothetical protein
MLKNFNGFDDYTFKLTIPILQYKVMGLISLWFYKENNKLQAWKNVFTLHIPPWAPHTYEFIVLTSLTHPRKILFAVLQIGKAKDLSSPLRTVFCYLLFRAEG